MNVSIEHPTNRPNFTRVQIGVLALWFSYETIIAFAHPSTGRVAAENEWGVTTGKHLNHISDKSTRVQKSELDAQLANLLPE